ncbi:MAG: adenine deaminase, partial [Deltaproteobacteria bacterium]|nr:adenine deaminase [Deltaproteobacteria bacterium]
MDVEGLKRRIRAARGEEESDLVLKGARIVNVFSGRIREGDLAVFDGWIVGIGTGLRGKREVDLRGRWVVPGLIDAHIHVESSMMLPSRLAAALLPHGTTAIVSDPHEIANVLGLEGIRFMMRESASIPFDVFFMAPSCVPATHLETSGAEIDARALRELKEEPRVLGLAEMMNYPGVLSGDAGVLEKLGLFGDRILDGHAPGLLGRDLQAYVSAGIRSDHESSDPEEGRQKLDCGMMVFIREGTSARNLEALLPLVTKANARRFCLVSDDLHPGDILGRGHLDHVIRRAIGLGLDPVTALRLATLNPAEHFGLKDRGALAPGYRADLAVLGDLAAFDVRQVYKDGVLVAEEGEVLETYWAEVSPHPVPSFHMAPLSPEGFRIARLGETFRVIRLVPGQILTGLDCEQVGGNGRWVQSDPDRDILKLAVVERHRASGRIGLGLVRGFGLKTGALASSIAHDSHNVIAVGVGDGDLSRAVEAVRDMGGGMCAVREGRVVEKVPLEVAGLMSRYGLADLSGSLNRLGRAASGLGCTVAEPFMAL